MRNYVRLYNIDVIVNCAVCAIPIRNQLDREIAFSTNVIGPQNLARVMKEKNGFLLHISCDRAIADNYTYVPQDKGTTIKPCSPLGQQKRAAECRVHSSGCRHIILRATTLYSEYSCIMVTLINKMMREPHELIASTRLLKMPTYALNVAEAIMVTLRNYQHYLMSIQELTYDMRQIFSLPHHSAPTASISHFCDNGKISAYAFAKKIATLLGAEGYPISAMEDDLEDFSMHNTALLDCRKVMRDFCIQQPAWE